jgi:hypothetical protein
MARRRVVAGVHRHKPSTPTFCEAMILIIAGVALGLMDWAKVFKEPESF